MFSLAFAGFNGLSYAEAWSEAKEQYLPLMLAGWKLWPLVSLVGFSLVKSVEGRNLLGSLAGLGWGVYLSLTMSGHTEALST
jgi:protein Mpv17